MEAPWRARFAVTSVVLLLVLIVLSVWRQRMGISYEKWQAWHGIIAVLVVLFALLHASLVGLLRHRRRSPRRLRRLHRDPRSACWPGSGLQPAASAATAVAGRGVDRRARQRLDTLVIEPVGHPGFRFDPGQFGWIAVNRSPFSITQHPFSFSSTADTEPGASLAMTIKAAGDFTATIPA